MKNRFLAAVAALVAALVPAIAAAHEVYILSGQQISTDLSESGFDMMAVALDDIHRFFFWGFIAVLTIVSVFLISIIRPLEQALAPIFKRIKPYAPAVSRITIGIAFIAAAYFKAIFGPELPLEATFGAYAQLVTIVLVVIGVLIIIGLWARAAALVALALFGFAIYKHGWYMVTYTNYLGEILVLLILGSHRFSVHSVTGLSERFHRSYHFLIDKIQHLAFPILRVCFGISLLFASIYAKIIHNNLALQIASLPLAGHEHSIAYYFGFDPHFLVLGAAIIEILVGLFFLLGIEIRFVSLFLLFWLSLSLWYFGEAVWPHIILIGIPIAFLMHGYDKYSLEGFFFKKRSREPVL